jgi:hypothetical protein
VGPPRRAALKLTALNMDFLTGAIIVAAVLIITIIIMAAGSAERLARETGVSRAGAGIEGRPDPVPRIDSEDLKPTEAATAIGAAEAWASPKPMLDPIRQPAKIFPNW